MLMRGIQSESASIPSHTSLKEQLWHWIAGAAPPASS
jgi:hypothetical protein